nr:MAG TPA: hypothetical protein [Caudoviricetes sp.]
MPRLKLLCKIASVLANETDFGRSSIRQRFAAISGRILISWSILRTAC